jgi:hypothetical protein
MRAKLPNKHSRFAFAVVVKEDVTTYRLSRRLFNGVLQFRLVHIPHGTDRKAAANLLRYARKELLGRTDAIELQLLSLTPGLAAVGLHG